MMSSSSISISVSLLFVVIIGFNAISINADDYPYNIGAGIYDITGPAAHVEMMGYAKVNQTSSGIHLRLWARAFVIVDKTNGNRIAYVNMDLAMSTIVVKKRVMKLLDSTFPGVYSYANVLLTSIHTHSGPGGYSWYTLFDIFSWGSKEKNIETIAQGVYQAIVIAHKQVKSAKISAATGTLTDASINRSPYSYQNNPPEERAQYAYDTDKDMTLIRFSGEDGTEIGLLNWFAVHGTSMTNVNRLISGDNKGYAMYMFEKLKNGNTSLPGSGPFVAVFSNANEGDSSPNTRGAFCPDGTPCEYKYSTCDGSAETCNALGPGKDYFQSTQIIGTKQLNVALDLYNNASVPIRGGLKYVHTFTDMEGFVVSPQFSGLPNPVATCHAALGDSFAAGTTDGPGDFDFRQGSNSTKDNPFWNLVGNLLAEPPAAQIACQAPKPILLYTGGSYIPTDWSPNILPAQIYNIGQLFIAAVPAEFTTMSGRRLKNIIRQAIQESGGPADAIVVIAGLSNAYSHYVATFEEYQIQRYEGASTLFGPHTHHAYCQIFDTLTRSIIKGTAVPPGIEPTDFDNIVPDLVPGVLFDDGPIGDIYTAPAPSYKIGDTASVTFYSADLRNDYRTGSTYLTVESKNTDGTWKQVAVDGDWETKFYWSHHPTIELEESLALIEWDIPQTTLAGTYRIKHMGYKKNILGTLDYFEGVSPTFEVS